MLSEVWDSLPRQKQKSMALAQDSACAVSLTLRSLLYTRSHIHACVFTCSFPEGHHGRGGGMAYWKGNVSRAVGHIRVKEGGG